MTGSTDRRHEEEIDGDERGCQMLMEALRPSVEFPTLVRLGANRIAYRESEIRAQLASRPYADIAGDQA